MSAHSPIAIVVFPLSNDFVTKKKKDDLAAHLHPSLFPRHVYFSPSWKHAWPPSSLFGGLQAPQHLYGFASSVFHQLRKIRLRNLHIHEHDRTGQIHGTGEDSGLWISGLLWLWVPRISYKSCMQHGYPHTWSCMQSNVTDRQINAGSVSPQIRKVSNIDGELFSLFNGGSRMSILFIKWNWTLTKTALLVFFTL